MGKPLDYSRRAGSDPSEEAKRMERSRGQGGGKLASFCIRHPGPPPTTVAARQKLSCQRRNKAVTLAPVRNLDGESS